MSAEPIIKREIVLDGLNCAHCAEVINEKVRNLEEIESLKHKLEIANNKLNMIKRNAQVITPDQLLEIIENYTGFFGKGSDK